MKEKTIWEEIIDFWIETGKTGRDILNEVQDNKKR